MVRLISQILHGPWDGRGEMEELAEDPIVAVHHGLFELTKSEVFGTMACKDIATS